MDKNGTILSQAISRATAIYKQHYNLNTDHTLASLHTLRTIREMMSEYSTYNPNDERWSFWAQVEISFMKVMHSTEFKIAAQTNINGN